MARERFEVTINENNKMTAPHCKVIVDTETGVNYLFVQQGYSGGLTPLLDKDGKPIVTK